jgi:hypothetical protein
VYLPAPHVGVDVRCAAQLAEHATVVMGPDEVQVGVVERALDAADGLVVGYLAVSELTHGVHPWVVEIVVPADLPVGHCLGCSCRSSRGTDPGRVA